jgi:prevent-host-death family protein
MCYSAFVTRIGVRELRQHASRYLDVVKEGGTVEVTERGRLVALLVPPSPASSARDQLVTSGRMLPARAAFRLPVRRALAPKRGTPSETLAGLRDERHA